MRQRWSALLLIFLLSVTAVSAQNTFNAPPESGRLFALSSSGGNVQLAELPGGFGGTITVDYHPTDARRWARVDNFGILRFVDPGSAQITEGVYTAPPFFDGFQADSPANNKYFVREVEWSPDGRMLAFRSENNAVPDLDQGVWYWAGVFQLATDPSYQLLRPCPGFCSAAGVPDNDAGWQALDLAWSSDNRTILIHALSFANGGRRTLMLKNAERVDPPPATVAPRFLLFDYGHWAQDGQRIVVSGNDPAGQVSFGLVDRSGNGTLTPAQEIGMAWVQDAVQRPDGALLMLGSSVGANAPLQLVDETGTALTPPIGSRPPQSVNWSPDRSAALIRTAQAAFIAQIDGTVTDITRTIANSPNIDWVNGALPAEWLPTPLPAPLVTGTFAPTPTVDISSTAAPPPIALSVGDLLQVSGAPIAVYLEPSADALQVATLQSGDELIITDGPLQGATVTWYRVQSLNHNGWIRDTSSLVRPADG